MEISSVYKFCGYTPWSNAVGSGKNSAENEKSKDRARNTGSQTTIEVGGSKDKTSHPYPIPFT